MRGHAMLDESAFPGCGGIDLILQPLVRKLPGKGLPPSDDVQSMSCGAMARLEMPGGDEAPRAVSGATGQG